MPSLKPTLCILLLGLMARVSSEEARSDSEVFPLVFNPFDVSHFKCVGYTLFENTAASTDYTYEVDVCFMAALATKLAFPWLYQYFTGQALFPQLRELGIPLLDGGASADVRGEVQQMPDYLDYYESFQAPSIQERASTWFSELGKAVHKEPNSRQQRKRQRQKHMGENMQEFEQQEEVNYRREPEYQQKEEEELGQVSGFGQRDQFRERKRVPMFNY